MRKVIFREIGEEHGSVWDWDVIDVVKEFDHDYYRSKNGYLILVNCNGDHFIVEDGEGLKLRSISLAYERRCREA